MTLGIKLIKYIFGEDLKAIIRKSSVLRIEGMIEKIEKDFRLVNMMKFLEKRKYILHLVGSFFIFINV